MRRSLIEIPRGISLGMTRRRERLRSALALVIMLLAVAATYWPLRPADIPADRATTLVGSDFSDFHARRLRYAREALFGPDHYLPAWYTRELGGTPFWSNVQNFPFIPTRLPLLLIDPDRAYLAGVMIAALLAATFTFFYLRQIGLGAVASAAGGWTFACSGFFASRVMAGHLPLLEAYPALPLLLWLIERSRAKSRISAGSLVALAVASMCIALSGHPQIPIYSFAVAAPYILLISRRSLRDRITVLASMVFGIGMASFALVPMLMLIARSTRVLSLLPPANDIAMPYGRLIAMLFPWHDGWPPRVLMPQPPTFHGYPDLAYFWDTVSYIGWLPIAAVLIFLTFAIAKRQPPNRRTMFFAIAGVAALVFALPWWQTISSHIPGTILRSPARQVYITTFALALALAAAVDVAMRFAVAHKPILLVPCIAILLALHAFDLGYRHDRAFVCLVPVGTHDERALEALRQRVGNGRVAIDCTLGTRANREIDDIGFFDSIILARPYRALMELSHAASRMNIQRCDGSQAPLRALRFFGVKLMVTLREPAESLAVLGQSGRVKTFAVQSPLDRASLVELSKTKVLSSEDIHEQLQRDEFDPENALLLPAGADQPAAGREQPDVPSRVDYSQVSSDEFIATVTTPRPVYLRLLETWDDGWRATVDDRPVELIPAYDVFMAIPIAAGTHEIRLTFSTPGAPAGAAVSIICLVLLCGLCGQMMRRQTGQASAT